MLKFRFDRRITVPNLQRNVWKITKNSINSLDQIASAFALLKIDITCFMPLNLFQNNFHISLLTSADWFDIFVQRRRFSSKLYFGLYFSLYVW